MATLLMMSHHAFRRDIARFAVSLDRLPNSSADTVSALQEEWQFYRGALHGHHTIEDTQIFPGLKEKHEAIASVIDQLLEDHHKIDPLLERGDVVFAGLPKTRAEAVAVISELAALLDTHLETEEAGIVSFLRDMKAFPAPGNDEEAGMYAQGFSWSMHGIADEVLAQVYTMLPDNLTSRLPAARATFDKRCERVWGSATVGKSNTSVPGN
jgi:hemerythrin-like domain-containing protein